ncbi:oligosaccharide repeat unit polymerase [Klebsiella oxytoca]|uniref:oligosaccharide repeat unit polymerase n=1 Tax=Klebsiella oxytoca TaxID=571 RepID=UPI003AAE860E
MKKLYLNPLYLFGYAFLTAMGLYGLGLSGLYVNGDGTLTTVLFILCLISLVLGVVFDSLFGRRMKNEIKDESYNKFLAPNYIFVLMGFAIDCIASGTIPLISILKGDVYAYKDFGLKTFHVFYMAYMSAFAIVSFERYLATKSKKFLLPAITGLAITVLIVSRGSTMLLLIPMALLYLSQKKTEKKRSGFKKNITIIAFALIFIIGFGYVGDKRMIASGYKSDTAIMEIGQANDVFYEIPSGFFWVYLYSSSPYANLASQQRFNNVDKGDFGDFFSSSVLPDFISKYTAPYVFSKFQPKRITDELTVGTGFSFALVSFGVLGVIFLYSWMVFLSFILAWVNRNKYINSICAVLSSTAILMIFDNMFIFGSCVLQMLMLTIFTRIKLGKYYFM